MEDEAKILDHFSDALCEIATRIVDLEDSYFRALDEVITKMEKALHDISLINTHYVSQVVTIMSTWQEAVQTAASHMETMDTMDTTLYLAHHEDTRKVTKEYVATVVKAQEEHVAAHAVEKAAWKAGMKADDLKDPVIRLLHITHKAARAQSNKA